MGWILLVIGILAVFGGVIFLMFYYEKDTNSTVDRAQNLSQKKYDPNMTRYAAAKESQAASARADLLSNVNLELDFLSQTIDKEAAALQAQLRKDDSQFNHVLERNKTIADHDSYIVLADNTRIVAQMASSLGIDPGTMKELVLEKAKMETQLSFKFREMELEVEKHRRLKEVDFFFEKQVAELDTKMADVANLLTQHELSVLHNQLSGIHFEYDRIKQLEDGEFKEKELARIEKKMKAWEAEIDERTAGLS